MPVALSHFKWDTVWRTCLGLGVKRSLFLVLPHFADLDFLMHPRFKDFGCRFLAHEDWSH
jgi:hypothetical protein